MWWTRGSGLAACLALLMLTPAGCGTGSDHASTAAPARKTVKVGLAYDIGGRGDKSFNDAAAAGLERAKRGIDVQTEELEAQKVETDQDKYARLKLLCQSGYSPVIAVGFAYGGPLARAARECPDTKFAIVDDATVQAPNVANLLFAEEQGSFLVGAAAALKSKTGRLGFIGGCLVPLLLKFEAGFAAGAKAVNPAAKVDVKYLSTAAERCKGFNVPEQGQTTAKAMYDRGVDVVYQAAGGSGTGVFRAAKAAHAWAIGVDSDQRELVVPNLRPVIITSMLKRVDNAVFDFVKSVSDDTFTAGAKTYDLAADGVGYSTSGGALTDIKPKLDDLKRRIVSGEIKVPIKPA